LQTARVSLVLDKLLAKPLRRVLQHLAGVTVLLLRLVRRPKPTAILTYYAKGAIGLAVLNPSCPLSQ
jgi:hypothetical protein